VRRARPIDEAAIIGMFERCSAATRFQRWHGHTTAFPRGYLASLLHGTDDHLGYVVECGDDIVGVASAVADGPYRREVAILIEDAWQHQGLGEMMMASLVAASREHGAQAIKAEVLAGQAWVLHLLRRHGPVTTSLSYGVIAANLRL
jgi:GNAT superfamily N-acetyltransferase